MTDNTYYPSADRLSRWYGDLYLGAEILPDKVTWHSTETSRVPGYRGGGSAPHLTYDPPPRRWFQHYPADRSARALRNAAGGVETNTDHVLQVEIVAYSDEDLAQARGHLAVSDLTDDNLADLAEFARWAAREWTVPLTVDPGWVREDYDRPVRMSMDQWRAFTGHTGHNRVPENTHWDPAALDIDTILALAAGREPPRRPARPPRTLTWTENVVRSLPLLRQGAKGEDVETLQGLLIARGSADSRIDGDFGPLTERAVRREQAQAGIEVDGVVYVQTWPKLLRV